MHVPQFEYDLITSINHQFPLRTEKEVRDVVETIRNERNKGSLDLAFIESELLFATRKVKLQQLIRELIAGLPPSFTPRLGNPPGNEKCQPPRLNHQKKNKGRRKNYSRKKRSGLLLVTIHNKDTDTITEHWIREAEEARARNHHRLEVIEIYDAAKTPKHLDIWIDNGLTPPPIQE